MAHFPGEVQAIAFLLQVFNNAEALVVVPEASGMQRAKLVFADVSKGCVPEVVAERDGFRSSLRFNALAMVLAIWATSRVWVSLVT